MKGKLSESELAHLEVVTARMVRAKMPHFDLVERVLREQRELRDAAERLVGLLGVPGEAIATSEVAEAALELSRVLGNNKGRTGE